MKLKPFTVVSICLCGCDQAEVHWTRAATGDHAAQKVKTAVFDPGENSPIAGRDIDVIAVFRGHLRNQI